jgi:hypothetical protein
MTVKELIEALKKQPQDKKVVIRSYDSGYDEAKYLEFVQVKEDPDHPWWNGSYAYVWEMDRDGNTIEAVQIVGG